MGKRIPTSPFGAEGDFFERRRIRIRIIGF